MASSTSHSNNRQRHSTPANLPRLKSIAWVAHDHKRLETLANSFLSSSRLGVVVAMPGKSNALETNHVITVLWHPNACIRHEIARLRYTKGNINPIELCFLLIYLRRGLVNMKLTRNSLLDRLIQENEELRAQIQPGSPRTRNTDAPWQPTPTSNDQQHAAEEQILEEIDWFTHTRTSDTPIWIGEISDAAFATRFRQFASSSQTPSHIPRTQFASDDDLRLLESTSPAWPSLPRARLLVQTALQFLRNSYHIVRRSEILSALNACGSDPSNVGMSPITKAKLWALFALGELRSSKCLSSGKRLPGLAYFAVASDTIRMISERPQLDVIETILILVSYLDLSPIRLANSADSVFARSKPPTFCVYPRGLSLAPRDRDGPPS